MSEDQRSKNIIVSIEILWWSRDSRNPIWTIDLFRLYLVHLFIATQSKLPHFVSKLKERYKSLGGQVILILTFQPFCITTRGYDCDMGFLHAHRLWRDTISEGLLWLGPDLKEKGERRWLQTAVAGSKTLFHYSAEIWSCWPVQIFVTLLFVMP